MPVIIQKTLYTFAELDAAAKERARDEYREHALDYKWWSSTYDDFEQICDCLGIDLHADSIIFAVSGSQGDGSAIAGYAPGDAALSDIAGKLEAAQAAQAAQAGTGPSDGGALLRADVEPQGHYYTLRVSVECNDRSWAVDSADALVTQALRDLADWLYSHLQEESEYLLEDAQVDEGLRCSEALFDSRGHREGVITGC